MDDIVKQALAKWPNVPACYGWLGLDARGRWYLRDDLVQAAGPFPQSKGSLLQHEKLIEFIERNYEPDPHGQYQAEAEKGQPSGYASLGTDGKVPAAQLPPAAPGVTDHGALNEELKGIAQAKNLTVPAEVAGPHPGRLVAVAAAWILPPTAALLLYSAVKVWRHP